MTGEKRLRQRLAEIEAVLEKRALLGGVEINKLGSLAARIRMRLSPPESAEQLDNEAAAYLATLQFDWARTAIKEAAAA